MLNDTFKHRGLRKKMIQQLVDAGITNRTVLRVMEEVPRHWFLETAFLDFAYGDEPFPNRAFFGILPSLEVAKVLCQLNIQPHQKVLEVGIGTGYTSVLMRELKAKVFAIENDKQVFLDAGKLFQKLAIRMQLYYQQDLMEGLILHAPFDHIHVMLALPYEPRELMEQLTIQGTLVYRIKEDNKQKTLVVKRLDETSFETTELI